MSHVLGSIGKVASRQRLFLRTGRARYDLVARCSRGRLFSTAFSQAGSMGLPSVPEHVRHDGKLSALYVTMNRIAPLQLADSSWDNVGILVQAPEPTSNSGDVVLLCNDLTTAVADEALKRGDVAVIMTYHPTIFRGLKELTLANTQQRSLLRLAAANISVYAAHTSIDVSTGGNADWLARVVQGYTEHDVDLSHFSSAKPVEAAKSSLTEGDSHPNAGFGRIATLEEPASVNELVERIKKATGLQNVIVGVPDTVDAADKHIRSVAVAAGSAGSILAKSNAQAWLTGELSHHEALAAVEKGIVVILTLHGNSERAYLRQVLQKRLQNMLDEEESTKLRVIVSSADREPLTIV